MSAGLSIHVVDVSRAKKATGLRVIIDRLDGSENIRFADARVPSDGQIRIDDMPGLEIVRGRYQVTAYIAEYYRAEWVKMSDPPFIETIVYPFGVDDPNKHYHLPLKMTPWGFSLFRGN